MLAEEKTLITSITQGFYFLGFNVRKYGDKLLIKPSKSSVKSFLEAIRMEIRKSTSIPTIQLIRSLNRKITGWVNYYRHVVAKKIFSSIDAAIFRALYQMLKRKHPRKPAGWIYRKYFTNKGMRRWIFHAVYSINADENRSVMLTLASSVPIRRHRQIKSAATPYDAEYLDYFKDRARRIPLLQHAAGSKPFGLMMA